MTEINTTLSAAKSLARPTKPAAEKPEDKITNAMANRMGGLSSGINVDNTINTIMMVEKRRMKPIEGQKQNTLQEIEAFKLVRAQLEQVKGTVEKLASSGVWDGKSVESSNPEVVTATATSGAKPGKYTLMVDRLAMNHQITSQGFELPETQVGTGKMVITVGENAPVTVVLDESNNTLKGLKDAINLATDDVQATIIKTGSTNRPYQLVLTSKDTGVKGRIVLQLELRGGETPNFANAVEEPSAWEGVGTETASETVKPVTGTGASTTVAQVVGEYTGEEDNKFTFTAVQTGVVGESPQLQLRWNDLLGRNGVLELDSFHYAPGESMEFVDGLALIFSPGEIVVGDKFSFATRARRSDLDWWVPAAEREPAVMRPTSWGRQQDPNVGSPIIAGTYTGTENAKFTLTVMGSGQIGQTPGLSLMWDNGSGLTGVLRVGEGYQPGSQLALTDGLTVALNSGVLAAGQTSTFDAIASDESTKWWLADSERVIPARVENISTWTVSADQEGEQPSMPDLPASAGPRFSNSQVSIGGAYTGDDARVYTFTALKDGTIGTTRSMRLRWEDDKGKTGELSVGDDYQMGVELPFDSGLTVAFGPGRLFKDDRFTLRTRTSTIQPPHDALIRFGATALGGGLEVTSSKNEMSDVIDGVRLNLIRPDDKPVTVTIRGETEKAVELVKGFVNDYNQLAEVINELTKFDKDNNLAGPLLSNREVTDIRTQISDQVMNPVAGLPKNANMLMTLGARLNDKGIMTLDENLLMKKVTDDFALVSDLFRSKGDSDNSAIGFVGMTPETQVNADGYEVDITQIATQGHYVTQPIAGSILIDASNNRFALSVDGRESDMIEMPQQEYSLTDFAKKLQDAVTNDKRIGEMNVRVMVEGDRIKVYSGRYGANTSIAFTSGTNNPLAHNILLGGTSIAGQDVQGTVGGVPGEGNGILLKVPEKSGPASGIRLIVRVTADQLKMEGPEARIKVTRGIAGRLQTYLEGLVHPMKGTMTNISKGLSDRVSNLDVQLGRMEERINSKRERLQDKFTRMESQMSKLKSQQSAMASQMGGGKGIPGLPGL